MGKQEIGKKGEEVAEAYLRKKGYRILARNWSARSEISGKLFGELDIIARRGLDIVFVEVKAGTAEDAAFRPELHVSRAKLRTLRSMAQRWLAAHRSLQAPWQIDVIAVDFPSEGQPRLRHIPRAFAV